MLDHPKFVTNIRLQHRFPTPVTNIRLQHRFLTPVTNIRLQHRSPTPVTNINVTPAASDLNANDINNGQQII